MAGLLSLFKRKKPEELKCSAVVVSAGLARRMGGVDKVLAPLGELPVLVHTLYAFQDCPAIHEIIVVAREDLVVEVGRLCREFNLDKVRKVIVGGQERVHSVQAGLGEVDPEAELIAIHDGARPLVSQEIIRDTVARAALTGAAAPAVPLVDTIKRGEEGQTVETVDRSQLWAVQTPQVFEAVLIKAATKKALEDGELPTDDCGSVERLGMRVTLTSGSRENLKITTPLDLILGEAVLRARAEGVL